MPDRSQLTMTVPFMRAYTELLVQTCHRRGAHAIGGMAAFIPNRRDPGGHRGRAGQGARGQGTRVGRRVRRHVGGPPRPRPDRDRDLRSRARRPAAPEGSVVARRSRCQPAQLLDLRVPDGAVTRGRGPRQRPGRPRVSRQLAARQRGRRDRQPDGGRGHGRDRAIAAVALADPRQCGSPMGGSWIAALYEEIRDEELAGSAAPRRVGSPRRPTFSTGSSSTTTSPSS